MPYIEYTPKKFAASSLDLIETANEIIAEYTAAGYSLTLRQLYYQFVARDIVPNNMRSYKRIGSILNDARLAGLVDWNAIEDRTRNVQSLAHWSSAAQIVRACADQFRVDKWKTQPEHVEVWIEKEALVGVIERVCNKYDVPFLACRGYLSQSEQWAASQRFIDTGKPVTIFHLGDHDPSGVDMTRDNGDRLDLFGANVSVNRLALNASQIDAYNPPPNPAKITDSRATEYIKRYGHNSWELDALEPRVIEDLIETNINSMIDPHAWALAVDYEEQERARLHTAADTLDEAE